MIRTVQGPKVEKIAFVARRPATSREAQEMAKKVSKKLPAQIPSPADLVGPVTHLLKLIVCLQQRNVDESDEHAAVLLRNIVKASRYMLARAEKRWLQASHRIPTLQAAFEHIYRRVRTGLSPHEEREQIRALLLEERLMPLLEQKGRDYAESMVTRLSLDDAAIRNPEQGGAFQCAQRAVQMVLEVSPTTQRKFDGESMLKAFLAPFAFGVRVSDLEAAVCALRLFGWTDVDFDCLRRMPTEHLPRDGELRALVLHFRTESRNQCAGRNRRLAPSVAELGVRSASDKTFA